MSARNYDVSISRVLAHEGGYTNHPSDPGGPTNWGITIHDARLYWKKGATAADVKAMPKSVAIGIYRAKYWDALRCDELPSGVDYAVFDYGVNSGIGRSGKVLRRVLGIDPSDWHVTDAVVAQAAIRNPAAIVNAICNERDRFLRSLKTWPVFGKGWARRVAEVRSAGSAMANSSQIDVPATKDENRSKGTIAAPAIAKPATAAPIVIVGPAAASGAANYAGLSMESIAIIAIAAFCVIAIIAGIIAYRHKSRAESPMPDTEIVGFSTD